MVKGLPEGKVVSDTKLHYIKNVYMGNGWQLMSQSFCGCRHFCMHLTASWWQLSQPYL